MELSVENIICTVFIHFIFRHFAIVWIVFVKLLDLVLLCMALPSVDFVGLFRGSIPAPCFFSFDFLSSLCFSHSLHSFRSLFFSSFPFSSFSDFLVVLFIISTTCTSFSVSFSCPRREMEKNVKMYYTH